LNQRKKKRQLFFNLLGLTVLHLAVLKERHEIVEHIVKTYSKSMDITDHQGRSAAHYAAVQPNAIYDTLLEHGANIHFPDKVCSTNFLYIANLYLCL
jgi:ankyrin repeat protein